jgi:hypothetical protein
LVEALERPLVPRWISYNGPVGHVGSQGKPWVKPWLLPDLCFNYTIIISPIAGWYYTIDVRTSPSRKERTQRLRPKSKNRHSTYWCLVGNEGMMHNNYQW